MKAGKRNIPKHWFGYDIRESEAYMRKLESMQRSEAEELELKLKEQRTLNVQIKTRIDELKLRTAAVPLPSDKTVLLLERLDRSVDAIERQGETETDSLRRLLERKRERHLQRMSEWDKQFESSREALDFLLDEAAALIGKVKEKEEPEPIENLEREAEEAMQVVPERLSEEKAHEEVEMMNERREKDLESLSSAKVLQFKLRSILNEAAAAEEDARESNTFMTADGLSVRDAGVEPETLAGLKREPISPAAKKSAPKSSSSFWGDLDPYLDEPETPQQPDFFAQVTAEPQKTGTDFTVATADQVSQERHAAPLEEPKPAGLSVNRESSGLTEEIHSIQNRYIVGKISGENLYAADGRLLIAKGQTITSEVVQSTEREGKLPDLIVHMVIPGFGVDES